MKFTFAKGASLADPARLFNSSLEGNVRRAIDIHEGERINQKALGALLRDAIALNTSRAVDSRAPSRLQDCLQASIFRSMTGEAYHRHSLRWVRLEHAKRRSSSDWRSQQGDDQVDEYATRFCCVARFAVDQDDDDRHCSRTVQKQGHRLDLDLIQ